MSQRRFLPGILASLLSLTFALSAAVFLILLLSDHPSDILRRYLSLPFSSSLNLGNLLSRTVLLSLSGAAVCVSFRAGLFNLGGEGQIYIGALAATVLWLLIPQSSFLPGVVLGLMAGGLSGAFLAAIPAVLKNHLNIEELLSTFLLSGAAVSFCDAVITGSLQAGDSYLITSPFISEKLRWSSVLPPSSLNLSFLPLLVLLAGLFLYFFYTPSGKKMELSGRSRELAMAMGYPVYRYTFFSLAASGFLFGLTGALAVGGVHFRLIKGFSSGMGWSGITVSLIAGNHPLFLPFSAFFLSFLEEGGKLTQIYSSSTRELSLVVQAVVLLVVTSRRFRESIVRIFRRFRRD